MSRGRTERILVTAVNGDVIRRRPDELIVEEPMTIQLDGIVVTTTMRTPGHDFELAVGFCHSDGLLRDAAGAPTPAVGVRYCGSGSAVETAFNVVTVETDGRAVEPSGRFGTISSSCGWCGSDQIDELVERLTPFGPAPAIPLDVLRAVPEAALAAQDLFERTGAVHAAAVFDPSGAIELVREDVGRHNAVDKVIGALALAGRLPATDLGLFVSGRASVEIVQKAWSAGLATVVAVSAPTALAVSAARRANMTLVGFVRDGSCNVYAPERLPEAVVAGGG